MIVVRGRTEQHVAENAECILFVTDEVFLPHRNGSSQIYSQVALAYARAGWRVCCLSFYRNRITALAPETLAAYQSQFAITILAPGWNLGGTLRGTLGMAWREATRWITGNVFATHPFLVARDVLFQDRLVTWLQQLNVGQIYFHKLHTMLMLEPMLDRLWPWRLVVDLHDDFVDRSDHYNAAYRTVFAALPWHEILMCHRGMYLRHLLGRTDVTRSRRREMILLARCHEIRAASESEYEQYASHPALAGRVRHVPWQVPPATAPTRRDAARPFHAGFIAADSVMNLDAVIYLRDAILPLIRASMPEFRMLIAGTAASAARQLLRDEPGVAFWDKLPEIGRFYAAIQVAAVPLRHGTGVSVKALEALSHGCALVTTQVGIRGLGSMLRDCDQVDIADDAGAFAAALVRRAAVTEMEIQTDIVTALKGDRQGELARHADTVQR